MKELQAMLEDMLEKDEKFRDSYKTLPKCKDCGYPEYIHPILWHTFNGGWEKK